MAIRITLVMGPDGLPQQLQSTDYLFAGLRLGDADSAAPAPQTISVQDVATGTLNTAGAALTIAGSRGTGTGAGGPVIIQVAPAGSTGTVKNALATAVQIGAAGDFGFYFAGMNTGRRGYKLESTTTNQISFRRWSDGFGVATSSIWRVDNSISADTFVFSNGDVDMGNAVLNWNAGDLKLTRAAAATLQFGAADAAAPVAQTARVQSVATGTTNTAGAARTIQGSRGTGTGLGGSLIWQVAPAGSTGTAQNAWANTLVINSAHLASFTGPVKPQVGTLAQLGSAVTPGVGAKAFVIDASTTLVLGIGTTVVGGGTNKVPVYSDGTNWIYG